MQANSEEIIGYSIDYFRGLLEDPNIWLEESLNFDPLADSQSSQLEKFIASSIFTSERVVDMLNTLTQNYIVLTRQEVELWEQDSLEFYIN